MNTENNDERTFYVKTNRDLTYRRKPTFEEILNGLDNIQENDENEYDIYFKSGDVCYYDHTHVGENKNWEPEGEYILIGKGRDGLPQFKVNGTGNTTFIGSVFTFGFLINPEKGGCITYKQISWEEFDSYIEKMNTYDYWRPNDEKYFNFTGHEQTAQLLGIPMNRITIRAKPGDKIVWAQYKGPRLEEGSTTVPDGAEFIPMKAEIYSNKMLQVVNKIKDMFIKK